MRADMALEIAEQESPQLAEAKINELVESEQLPPHNVLENRNWRLSDEEVRHFVTQQDFQQMLNDEQARLGVHAAHYEAAHPADGLRKVFVECEATHEAEYDGIPGPPVKLAKFDQEELPMVYRLPYSQFTITWEQKHSQIRNELEGNGWEIVANGDAHLVDGWDAAETKAGLYSGRFFIARADGQIADDEGEWAQPSIDDQHQEYARQRRDRQNVDLQHQMDQIGHSGPGTGQMGPGL